MSGSASFVKVGLGALGAISALFAAYLAGQQGAASTADARIELAQAQIERLSASHTEALAQRDLHLKNRETSLTQFCDQKIAVEANSFAQCTAQLEQSRTVARKDMDRALTRAAEQQTQALDTQKAFHEKVLADAIVRTEAQVRAEMTSDQRLAEVQTKSLAAVLAVLQQPVVRDAIPVSYKPVVDTALTTVPDAEVAKAVAGLPPLPEVKPDRDCVPTGKVIEMWVGQFVDQCESGSTLVMTRRYYAGPNPFIELTIDGADGRLILGRTKPLKGGCQVSLLAMTNPKGDNIAALRFGCS